MLSPAVVDNERLNERVSSVSPGYSKPNKLSTNLLSSQMPLSSVFYQGMQGHLLLELLHCKMKFVSLRAVGHGAVQLS